MFKSNNQQERSISCCDQRVFLTCTFDLAQMWCAWPRLRRFWRKRWFTLHVTPLAPAKPRFSDISQLTWSFRLIYQFLLYTVAVNSIYSIKKDLFSLGPSYRVYKWIWSVSVCPSSLRRWPLFLLVGFTEPYIFWKLMMKAIKKS